MLRREKSGILLLLLLPFLLLHVVLATSSELYYQVGDEVHGPFPSGQVYDWFRQGWFGTSAGGPVLVSSSPDMYDCIPVEYYFEQQQQVVDYYGRGEQGASRAKQIVGKTLGELRQLALSRLVAIKEKAHQVVAHSQQHLFRRPSHRQQAPSSSPWDEYDEFGNYIPPTPGVNHSPWDSRVEERHVEWQQPTSSSSSPLPHEPLQVDNAEGGKDLRAQQVWQDEPYPQEQHPQEQQTPLTDNVTTQTAFLYDDEIEREAQQFAQEAPEAEAEVEVEEEYVPASAPVSVKSLGGSYDYQALWTEDKVACALSSRKSFASVPSFFSSRRPNLQPSSRLSQARESEVGAGTHFAQTVISLFTNVLSLAGVISGGILVFGASTPESGAVRAALLLPNVLALALALFESTHLIRFLVSKASTKDDRLAYLNVLMRDSDTTSRWSKLLPYINLLRSTAEGRVDEESKRASSQQNTFRRWVSTGAVLFASGSSLLYLIVCHALTDLVEMSLDVADKNWFTRLLCCDAVKNSAIAKAIGVDVCFFASKALGNFNGSGVVKLVMAVLALLLPVLQWSRFLATTRIGLNTPTTDSYVNVDEERRMGSEWGGCRKEADCTGLVVSGLTTTDGTGLVDVSFTCIPASITVVVADSSRTRSGLANLLFNGYRQEHLNSGGFVSFHGRPLPEWSKESYQEKVVYLKAAGDEKHLELQAAAVAGCLPDAPPSELENHFASAEASGAGAILSSLPNGPGTFLSSRGSKGGYHLSSADWRTLAVCRALSFSGDRDKLLIVLDGITDAMGEANESKTFQLLRDFVNRDKKTVIVLASRLATAKYADQTLIMSSGRIVEQGDYSQIATRVLSTSTASMIHPTSL